MKKLLVLLGLLAFGTSAVSCGDDDGNVVPDTPPGGEPPIPPGKTFVQVEHLGRPGIAEALLLSEGFLSGYNRTAPTFTGVPQDTLNAVVGEAKTVLKAIYLGVCLLDGVAGLSPQAGLHPGGIECFSTNAVDVGAGGIFQADGVTQTAAAVTASQAYADAVFGLFEPDVMRVDTAVTSNYETLCGAGPVGLCGGRFLRDDTIDTTLDFLINGAASPKNQAFGQVSALVQDGVVFDNVNVANNNNSRVVGDPTNKQQGHPNVSNNFPYSAPPL